MQDSVSEKIAKKQNSQDLTKGNPFVVLLKFSLPLVLSMVFQQMYNIVDSVVAGRFLGKNALAAVGASSPVTVIFIAVASGCSIGGSVIISQLFGRRENARLKSAVYTVLIAVAALSAVFTAAGLLSVKPLLRLLSTPSEIEADSAAYLAVYVWGVPAMFVYNAVTSAFTGLGDSRTPLYLLVFSSLLNIALDILFVTAVNMGVAGLGWATFIAQGLAALIALMLLLLKTRKIEADGAVKPFDFTLLKKITVVAVPSILQQSFVSVGQMCVQSLINGFGADTIGGYAAAMKVSVMAVSCYMTVSSALSSFAGQNIAAGKSDRVKSGLLCGLGIGAVLVAAFVTLFMTLGGTLTSLFVVGDDIDGVIAAGKTFLFVACTGYPLVMVKLCLDGILRGAGDMLSFMISTFSDLVLRVVISFVLAPYLGFMGICLSYPIGWLGGMIVSLAFYLCGRWKNKLKV
ncbi:MAG: MATE family efflux transporter [Clostridia bacterium]|nr:MATE family efflux transporter [Clostridia bacterium]